MALSAWDVPKVRGVLDSLADQGREVVLASGVDVNDVRFSYTVDMRHVGQGHEISVQLPEGDIATPEFREELVKRFHATY